MNQYQNQKKEIWKSILHWRGGQEWPSYFLHVGTGAVKSLTMSEKVFWFFRCNRVFNCISYFGNKSCSIGRLLWLNKSLNWMERVFDWVKKRRVRWKKFHFDRFWIVKWLFNFVEPVTLMDWSVVHDNNGLVWQPGTKATKEEAEVVCPYSFCLGIVSIEELMVLESLLR